MSSGETDGGIAEGGNDGEGGAVEGARQAPRMVAPLVKVEMQTKAAVPLQAMVAAAASAWVMAAIPQIPIVGRAAKYTAIGWKRV